MSKKEISGNALVVVVYVTIIAIIIAYAGIVHSVQTTADENAMNMTITIQDKMITAKNDNIIETDVGTFKTRWDEYSTLTVGKTYEVRVHNGFIREIVRGVQG